ncbi:MAG: site-specific integrase [Tannerellaceae bacterium]|nr:site-specific integrase [Tannerellaceae bacterium]
MFRLKNNPLVMVRNRSRRRKNLSLVILTGRLVINLQKEGRVRTARAYESTLRSFLQFAGREDFPVEKLSRSLLKRYEEYLLLKGRSLNTVSFYMRNLRAIYNKGVHLGLIRACKEELFIGVYTGVQQTSKRAARKEDIRKIARWLEDQKRKGGTNKDPLIACGYYFLFCFYARGMSYVDMAYLKKTDVRGGKICYRRRKTGQLLEITLTSELKEILIYFSPYVKNSIYLFPVIRKEIRERLAYETGLRIQNLRLKALSRILDLGTVLSTHVARHIWATVAKREHIPLSVISESLGHYSEKTTLIYLASFDSSVLDRANRRVAYSIRKS